MRKFLGSILVVISLYVALISLLYIVQRELIYFPNQMRPLPNNFGLEKYNADIIEIDSDKDISLYSWWIEPKKSNKSTILYFSGNAGHLGFRAHKIEHYVKQGYGALMISYRYNAGSGGSPSEENMIIDAKAAYDFLLSNNIPEKNIIIYGESLGSGVAAQLAASRPSGALILEAPYTSLYELAYTHYPMLPFPKLLVKDPYDTYAAIPNIMAPIFIMHGTKDNVIPFTHSEKLITQIKTDYVLYPLENYRHGGLYFNSGIEKEVLSFLNQHNL